MSSSLQNCAFPVLKWAPNDTHTELSDPSQLNSDDPNQDPTQQDQLANVVVVKTDESLGKSWKLNPKKSASAKTSTYEINETVNLDGEFHMNDRKHKQKEKFCISLTKEEIEEDF